MKTECFQTNTISFESLSHDTIKMIVLLNKQFDQYLRIISDFEQVQTGTHNRS